MVDFSDGEDSVIMNFTCILCTDECDGFGYQNTLPWANTVAGRDDLKDFKRYTTKTPGTAVIMGRVTRDGIPKFPLRNRINIVLTRQVDDIVVDDHIVEPSTDDSEYESNTGVVYAPSLDAALVWCYSHAVPKVMVIGGLSVFDEALQSPFCRKVRVTRIPGIYPCDCRFDESLLNAQFNIAYTYTRDTGCITTMFKRKIKE